jgi:acetyltransferase-like isoleucine patch superfamily enzyme
MRKLIKKIFIYLAQKNKHIERFYTNSAFIRTPVGLSLINFIFQRIFRINSDCDIPVNFTSRVLAYSNITHKIDKSTLLSFAVSGGTYIQAANGIKIGRNFLFAPSVKIISANHDFIIRDQALSTGPIIFGDNVWLGANVIILPGVELGDGCIAGAGAVVTKSFTEKNSVIAGNPAKLLKRY